MEEEKDKIINNREKYGDDFTCPDCGRNAKDDDVYDAGNGFCSECSPNH